MNTPPRVTPVKEGERGYIIVRDYTQVSDEEKQRQLEELKQSMPVAWHDRCIMTQYGPAVTQFPPNKQ